MNFKRGVSSCDMDFFMMLKFKNKNKKLGQFFANIH